jgi:serine phosphatase RsbU (regulator of sigma subunit)
MARAQQQPDESGATPVNIVGPKSRRVFSRLKRELTQDEMCEPGVQKMILQDHERIEGENRELQAFRDKYYDASAKLAVLETERRRSVAWEVLSSGCLAIGAAAIGFAPVMWSSQPGGWYALMFGAVVLLIGIVSRFFRL